MKNLVKFLEENFFIAYALVVSIAVFIFYMSSKTFVSSGEGFSIPFQSYIYHFGIFLLFNFFLLIALTRGDLTNKYLLTLVFLLSIAYAITDEIHQYFVPGRFCSYNDAVLDSIGIVSSGIFYALTKQ